MTSLPDDDWVNEFDEVFDLYDMIDEPIEDFTEDKPSRFSGEGELAWAMKVWFPSTVMPKDWQNDSLCGQLCADGTEDYDLWFAPTKSVAASRAADICFECPVRQSCLKWSTEAKAQYGIWGGMTAEIRSGKKTVNYKKMPAHSYDSMKDLPNPYDTEDPQAKTYRPNLWNQIPKACATCEEIKPPEDFKPMGVTSDGLSTRCMDCIASTKK